MPRRAKVPERAERHAPLRTRIYAQQQLIAESGGNLAGYIARYGSPDHPGCVGRGGPAIYYADLAALAALTSRLRIEQQRHNARPRPWPVVRVFDILATVATVLLAMGAR